MIPAELSAEIDAIVGGYHADPFRILGPHAIGDEWVVRAFLPHAASAAIQLSNGRVEMERLHPAGFFAVQLLGAPHKYKLAIQSVYGHEEVIDDPYRFGPIITNFDLHLHTEGTLHRAWETFGAHPQVIDGVSGVRFAVWAPSALNVTVTGIFNDWDTRRHPMRLRDGGVWELFIPGIQSGDVYKYRVKSQYNDYEQLKCDPYAFRAEVPPKTASVVHRWTGYQWNDGAWMSQRANTHWLEAPMSVYEVHLESWMKNDLGDPLSYRQLAHTLVEYVRRLHYTHIELMPIMEHPYSGSWGYQVTGFFAATSRFGTPEDFMFFIDACHQAGIGVLLDWVPGHFPKDAHGLAWFDGTALYEHADPRQGEHRGWGTNVFNYGRNEVRTFLVSNAIFWLEQFHIDGLRVDAVASMLFLDYGREADGDWIPNQFGGRENLDAVEFLKQFNIAAHRVPGAITIAEESTSFGAVTHPVYMGGLGFTMKWNMGWMHDMFNYFKLEPIFRRFNQTNITFSLLYAFTENFLLPISHDEVVHGKSSLIGKMPGDEWQRFANVRAFLGYMYGHPGKKLLFMGQELGPYEEWNWQTQIRWELLDYDFHRRLQALVAELNKLYKSEPALYEVDNSHTGFEWIDFRDVDASVIAFQRRAKNPEDFLVFVCNFTPVPRYQYRIGVPRDGNYTELLNTDSNIFGGSNMGNFGWRNADPIKSHGHNFSLSLTLPPLSVVIFKPEKPEAPVTPE
ncbi:MAG: 1,4-alpha-glucan branching protein GlgB [Bryobacterales bacterium]|nr:1,4-alpha-glucan branching protein GlgB [Bryobacterales bacterium]